MFEHYMETGCHFNISSAFVVVCVGTDVAICHNMIGSSAIGIPLKKEPLEGVESK